MATQLVPAKLKLKLAFATHILEAASLAPRLCDFAYRPLCIPHRPPRAMQSAFGLTSSQLRLFLFASAVSKDTHLFDAAQGTMLAQRAMLQQTPLWIVAASEPEPPPVPFPPAFAARFVLCVMQAVKVWFHATALYHTVNFPFQSTWCDLRHVPHESQHYVAVSIDAPEFTAPPGTHTWFLHPLSDDSPPPKNMMLHASSELHSCQWGLYGLAHAAQSLDYTQLLRLHCFFCPHRSGRSSLWTPSCHSPQLLRLYT